MSKTRTQLYAELRELLNAMYTLDYERLCKIIEETDWTL